MFAYLFLCLTKNCAKVFNPKQQLCACVSFLMSYSKFTFFKYINKKEYVFVKIFDFRFLLDFHVLECPENDFTIFEKLLFVGLSVCARQKFYGKCNSRTNAQKFMKLYIQLHLDINWCIGGNLPTCSAGVLFFQEFLGQKNLGFHCVEYEQ